MAGRTKIQRMLFELRDEKFAEFNSSLVPGVGSMLFIGVRTPALRKLAKDLLKEDPELAERFIKELPHKFFDENQLHAFIIAEDKDFHSCLRKVEDFLPHIDNWGTCDQLSPKVFVRHKAELLTHIEEWIDSGETYTIRFGIGMLMQHFLDGDFKRKYLTRVSGIRSEEYYVNMMIAWYFATALAKQYDAALPYIEKNRLDRWTHNKTIQKAVESYRVTEEQKTYLKTLRRK